MKRQWQLMRMHHHQECSYDQSCPWIWHLAYWVLEEDTVEVIPSAIGNGMHAAFKLTNGYEEFNIHERSDIQWVLTGESLLVFPHQKLMFCLVEVYLEGSTILSGVSNLPDGHGVGPTQTNLPPVAIIINMINQQWVKST